MRSAERAPLMLGIEAEVAAAALAERGDYRILRAADELSRRRRRDPGGLILAGCALDVRTVTVDGGPTEAVAVGLRRFGCSETGRIVDVGPNRVWTTDGSAGSAPETAAVAGPTAPPRRTECDAEISCLVVDAEFVVAFGAAGVRPAFERRFPDAARRPWVCAETDVDWPAFRIEPGPLGYVLMQAGRFAPDDGTLDPLPLLHLLDLAPESGAGVLGSALARACRPSWLVTVAADPRSWSDLSSRGYVGSPTGGWSIEVGDERVDRETEWLRRSVPSARRRISRNRLDWRSRHAVGRP